MIPFEKTEPVADTQDAYERIRSWLARPGATQCSDSGHTCKYADNNGNHCAIGGPMRHLLTEEIVQHNPCFMDLVSEGTDGYDDDAYLFWENADFEFLSAAQDAHDYAKDNDAFQSDALTRLDEAAIEFDLKVVTS